MDQIKILEVGSSRLINETSSFFSHWDITSYCNYRCHYCTYKNRGESFYPYEHKLKIIEFYDYLYNNYNLDLILFGGEPTIDPDILKILSRLGKSKRLLQIFTNLGMNLDFYKRLVKIRRDIKVLGSYHYEFIDNGKFLENVLFLIRHIRYVQVKIMWDSIYKEQIKKIYYKFKELENLYPNYNCSIDMIYHPSQKFTTEDIRWYISQQHHNATLQKYQVIYNSNGEIIKENISFNEIKRYCNGIANYKFFKCQCGRKNLIVCSNGDVHYCLTMRKNRKPPIFNIINDDFKDYLYILDNDIVCHEDNCYSEVCVPKQRLLSDKATRTIKCQS